MLFFKSLFQKIKENNCPSFGLNFLLVLFTVYLLFFHFYKNIQTIVWDLQNILIVLASFLSLIALHQIIELLTQKSPRAYRLLITLILCLYEYLYLYHYRMWHNFDYSLMATNWSEIFTPQSAQLIGSTTLQKLKIKDYVNITIFLTILLYWGYYKKRLHPRPLKYRWIRVLISITTLILVIRSPYTLYDEITFVAQSAYRYHFGSEKRYHFTKKELDYPYVHHFHTDLKLNKKYIFLVAMESFNANFVFQKVKGKELTPVFNSYVAKGLYNSHHYGHSIQTAKGHFSILCGLPPLTHKKAMKLASLHLHCLPQILKEHNYQTYFIQGYDQKNFDNSFTFMTRNGFDTFETTDTSLFSSKEKKEYIWGFGVQDNFTFKQAFRTIDRLHAQSPQQPIFTMIATISHHMENSIYVADMFLQTFFKELDKRDYLKDSLIILTGDHSFPAGEHGYYLNEAGSYKELFRTPLLILGSNIKKELTYNTSHQDIAPTILDFIGLNNIKVHFTGRSIRTKLDKAIPLIQPYDGVQLGGIIQNYKYMFQKRTRRHTLYDLTKDPQERKNIYDNSLPIISQFKKLDRAIELNDYLIFHNLIWPKNSSPPTNHNP